MSREAKPIPVRTPSRYIFVLKICKNDPHKEFFLSKPWLFAADLFVDMSPRFVYFLVGKAREGAILNALKAPALLVLSIPTPWIKARMLDQNRPGVQCIGAVNQVKHASSSKNSLLLFHTLGLQHYTLCFECCCSRFCFGNSRNRSQNFEFWLNAIQNLSFIICGSFIVFQLSCYSILSKDW